MVAKFYNPKIENRGRESPMIELKEIGTPVLISTTATVHPEPPPLPQCQNTNESHPDPVAPKPKIIETMANDLAKALALRREAMDWDA